MTDGGRGGPGSVAGSADPGRAVLIDPLLSTIQPATVFVSWIDAPPEVAFSVPGAITTSFGPEDLVAALERGEATDVIWLRGNPNWHTVGALEPALIAHFRSHPDDPPVLVVEGRDPAPLPPWSRNDTYAEYLERIESSKDGVRLSVAQIASRLDREPTILWCALGRGTAVLLGEATARRLEGWLAGRTEVLAALGIAHHEQVRLVGRSFELFELLDRSQHTGTLVVKSLRFRVGTRLVRLGRKLKRKEEVFRAPREILARQPVTEQWRQRLAAERDVGELALPPNPLRVTFVLPELRLGGGALVVSELVNELRVLGVDARIAALKVRGDIYRTRLLARPMVFTGVPEMMRELPQADILVATHWSTAPWVRDLVDAGRAPAAAYYVQDYEAWFYREDDTRTREQVKQTYALIPDKIVTSGWLGGLLQDDGHDARVIPPGLDLDVFYPRPALPRSRPIVLAMARPRTPRRGFDTVVATLARVHELVPSVEIVLFGERLGQMKLPFPYRGEGVITGQEHLAHLYASASVQFDGSDFQALGRPALEGMACGAVPVLTNVGGVNEYARDGENCILVPPRDPEGAAHGIARLLSDPALLGQLRAGGLTTVLDYSMRRRAGQLLDLLEAINRS